MGPVHSRPIKAKARDGGSVEGGVGHVEEMIGHIFDFID